SGDPTPTSTNTRDSGPCTASVHPLRSPPMGSTLASSEATGNTPPAIRASWAVSATPLAVCTPGRADSCARTDVSGTAPLPLGESTTDNHREDDIIEHQFDTPESTPSRRERQGAPGEWRARHSESGATADRPSFTTGVATAIALIFEHEF